MTAISSVTTGVNRDSIQATAPTSTFNATPTYVVVWLS